MKTLPFDVPNLDCKVSASLDLSNVIKKIDNGNPSRSDYRFDSKGSIDLTVTSSDCGFKLRATVSDKLEVIFFKIVVE